MDAGLAYRLTFLLPPTMLLRAHEGRHTPCLHGCVLIVRSGVVTIEGPSREQIFDQARRFFRVHAKALPPFTVAATLVTPPRYLAPFAGADRVRARQGNLPGANDSWTIIVNSDVALTTGAHVDIRPAPGALETEHLDVGDVFEKPRVTILSGG